MLYQATRSAIRPVVVLLVGLAGVLSVANAQEVKPTTPLGVTLVEVVRELGNSQPQFLWWRPGDAKGHTLFSYTKDDAQNARCVAECAKEFPPLLVGRDVKPSGDWTVIHRADGGSQWVYQGRPLYTWSKEIDAGQVATNVALLDTKNVKLAEGAVLPTGLVPPDDWKVARFVPWASMRLPDGIEVGMSYAYQAVALIDFRGHTVYAYSGDPKKDGQICDATGCKMNWVPVSAPALATTVGDFSVVTRADGSPQWAFKGQALYVYSADMLPGDVLGASVDANWKAAVLTQNFRPTGVGITRLEGYGDTFTLGDKTLYGGYAFGKRWGGRNLRDTFKDTYRKGKRLGATACDSAECLKSWTPFFADVNAQSGGFWEPITRADGKRQWAYKGYALYSFNGDSKAGEHLGQAVYAFEKPEGDAVHLRRVAFLEEVGKAVAAAGIYWNIAKP